MVHCWLVARRFASVMIMQSSLRAAIALAALVVLAVRPASAQTDRFWNYSGTNWGTAANWSPSGVPTSADTAILGPFDGATYNFPTFTASAVAGELDILGPRPLITSTFTGNGNTLTLGTGGVMTTAPLTNRSTFGHTLTLNNLTVNIANGTSFAAGYAQTIGAMELSGFSSRIMLTNSSRLRLVDAAGTSNYDLTINSGAQLLVNSGTQLTNGIGVNSAGQGAIRFHGGGILNFQGASNVASTFNANQVVAASGHSTVRVNFGGSTGTVTLNLGNADAALVNKQRGISRPSTVNADNSILSLGTGTIDFNFNGVIPGFTGSQATLNAAIGTTFTMVNQNGVITEGSSSNTNSPYVILTGQIPLRDGDLGRFATINTSTGVVTAQQGTQRSDSTLTTAAANENVIYRPSSGAANATLANNISPQTIVFEPILSGQSVNLNGFTLTTPGIIVERSILGSGAFTFSMEGGTIAGPASALRNIYVLGSSDSFFNVGATFLGPATSQGGGIVKSGGGTMVLTANTPQMNMGGDIFINQGALRARIDGANANLGGNNVLNLRGGVLEVDANGGTSTFSRSLGNGLGQVNWIFGTSTTRGDRGGGGFSVVNGNLNVNIGGAGATLLWNGTSGGNEFFIRSGQSLRLGSFQATGVTTLQNGLALDDGSANLPNDSREIITECLTFSPFPLYSQRARITGVISGSASTGLMKAGPGMLELTAANTYAGGTTVALGTLLVNNTTGSATGTGKVVVYDTLIGNGIIAPASGNGLTVMPSSRLFLYRDQFGVTPANLTVGSAGANNPVTLRAGASTLFQLNGTVFDPSGGPTSYGRLTVLGTGAIDVTGSTLNVGLNAGFTPSSSDLFGIIDNQTGNAITGTFASGATVNAVLIDNTLVGSFQVSYVGNISGSTITITGGNDVVLYNFQPVPEPASVLAVCAGAIGLFGAIRRRRSSVAGVSDSGRPARF
jgi:fibronectin-binding autotransporter adhesin